MKISYMSDVHLEFGDLQELPGGDVLVLAGDILVAKNLYWNLSPGDQHAHMRQKQVDTYNRFADQEFPKYKLVIAVAGNHEYYNGRIDLCEEALKKFYGERGAVYLQGQHHDVENIRFIGATLWTNFNNRDWFATQAAKESMNDFNSIKWLQGSRVVKFLPHDAADIHERHLAYIKSNLGTGRNVVITHHLPSYMSIGRQFVNSPLNPAYATELGYFIDQAPIHAWIHGHVHHSCNYMIGDCNILCNPRGYHGYAVNPDFHRKREIELL